MHRKIVNSTDIEKLQIDLGRLGELRGRKWDENKSR